MPRNEDTIHQRVPTRLEEGDGSRSVRFTLTGWESPYFHLPFLYHIFDLCLPLLFTSFYYPFLPQSVFPCGESNVVPSRSLDFLLRLFFGRVKGNVVCYRSGGVWMDVDIKFVLSTSPRFVCSWDDKSRSRYGPYNTKLKAPIFYGHTGSSGVMSSGPSYWAKERTEGFGTGSTRVSYTRGTERSKRSDLTFVRKNTLTTV